MPNLAPLQPLPLAEAMRKAYASQVPERLQRLDCELATGMKDKDVIFAVRAGLRFRIEVSRRQSDNPDRRYVAICFANGKKHRYYGERPSTAYTKLVNGSLVWTATQMQFERHSPDR